MPEIATGVPVTTATEATSDAVVVGVPAPRSTGLRPVSSHVGELRLSIFWWVMYATILAFPTLIILAAIDVVDSAVIISYFVSYILVMIFGKFLFGNTFFYLDLSRYPCTCKLDDDKLLIYKARTGICGCCPLPLPCTYVVSDCIEVRAITSVNVYRQSISMHVQEGRGGGGMAGGPTAEWHADPHSIQPVESPEDSIGGSSGAPTWCNLLTQPIDLMYALACGEARTTTKTQYFLGVKPEGRRIVKLSPSVFSPSLCLDCFAVRNRMRARLQAVQSS